MSPFTTFENPQTWLSRLSEQTSSGRTALYDAIGAANRLLNSSLHERRVIIALTDGADTASKISVKDLYDQIRLSNTLIYTVGLFNVGEPETNAPALKTLAEITGGQATFDADGLHLPDVFAAIMKDLRSRYLLGFYAEPPASGKVEVRRISVSAHGPSKEWLQVRSRREYRIGKSLPSNK